MDTDTHAPEDLITDEMAFKIAVGAGLDERGALAATRTNPMRLVENRSRG